MSWPCLPSSTTALGPCLSTRHATTPAIACQGPHRGIRASAIPSGVGAAEVLPTLRGQCRPASQLRQLQPWCGGVHSPPRSISFRPAAIGRHPTTLSPPFPAPDVAAMFIHGPGPSAASLWPSWPALHNPLLPPVPIVQWCGGVLSPPWPISCRLAATSSWPTPTTTTCGVILSSPPSTQFK